MVVIIEGIIILAAICGAVVLGKHVVKALSEASARRASMKQLREQQLMRLEAAKTAEQATELLLLDKELAQEVYCKLGEGMKEGSCREDD
jgi:hypothetical protein